VLFEKFSQIYFRKICKPHLLFFHSQFEKSAISAMSGQRSSSRGIQTGVLFEGEEVSLVPKVI